MVRLAPNGGLPFDQPLREGYRKLLVVLTRPRDYVKAPMPASVGALLRTAYRQFPSVFEGVAQRPDRYNAGRKFLFELEERGQAYVFAPDNLWINNTESRRERLEATYRAGLVQAVREMPTDQGLPGAVGVSGFPVASAPRSFPRHFRHLSEMAPNPYI